MFEVNVRIIYRAGLKSEEHYETTSGALPLEHFLPRLLLNLLYLNPHVHVSG